MADTPVILRGMMYNTRRVYRCPSFHSCEMCKQCTNYNKNNALCIWCESGKNQALLCTHTDKQQDAFLTIQNMFKKPISHVDDKPVDSSEIEKGLSNEAALIEAEKYLGIMGLTDVEY